MRGFFLILLALGLMQFLIACGGNSGTSPGTTTYGIGGSIIGLAGGESLEITNNSGDNLVISSNGGFTFATELADGASYNVQVATQPATQTCTASLNSGTVSALPVTGVTINCAANTYTVGGNLSGLGSGLGVTLTNNSTDNLVLNSNGAFTFPGPIADGAGYNVQVGTQPTGQACSLSNNSGSISSANVPNVAVVCTNVGSSAELDTSFNVAGTTPGIVVSDLGTTTCCDDIGNAIAIDSMNRIVVAGNSYIDDDRLDDMTIWRYLANGTPDNSFDSDGSSSLHNALGFGNNSKEFGSAMVIDGSGRIIVAGRGTENANQFSVDMVLWRVDTNGALDANFSGDGIASHANAAGGSDLNDIAYAVTLDNSGKILVCGESNNGTNADAVVWRYTDAGILDTSFNNPNGFKVFSNIGGGNNSDICRGIAVDSSDRILITGETDTGSNISMFMMRLLDNGTPDNNFDTDGIAVYSAATGSGYDIHLITDGDIVVGGSINSPSDFGVWRYDTTGSLDANFNSGSATPGVNITGISSTSNMADFGFSLAVDSTNKIYLTGFNQNATTSTDMVLIRLTESGELDTSFNPSATTPPPGIVTFHDSAGGNSGDQAYGITLDSNGKILVTGISNSVNSADMTIWRISP